MRRRRDGRIAPRRGAHGTHAAPPACQRGTPHAARDGAEYGPQYGPPSAAPQVRTGAARRAVCAPGTGHPLHSRTHSRTPRGLCRTPRTLPRSRTTAPEALPLYESSVVSEGPRRVLVLAHARHAMMPACWSRLPAGAATPGVATTLERWLEPRGVAVSQRSAHCRRDMRGRTEGSASSSGTATEPTRRASPAPRSIFKRTHTRTHAH